MSYWFLSDDIAFPHPLTASPEGILAIGGDLSIERLQLAYAFGIFPWYHEEGPMLWWFPDPRCVLKPEDIVLSKSMRALIRKQVYHVTADTAFEAVIRYCRHIPRKGQSGTWIQPEMVDAYTTMHRIGYAHSVEVWHDEQLVGGLYGTAMGKVFFGESMFSIESDTSKYALICLAKMMERQGFWLIDCQQDTPHLRSMGAHLMPASEFHALLGRSRRSVWHKQDWQTLIRDIHL